MDSIYSWCCFVIQSDSCNFCLLIGVFKTFIFNVIVGVVMYKSVIVLLFSVLSHLFFIPFFPLFLLYLDYFLFYFISFGDLLAVAPYFVILVVELGLMVVIFITAYFQVLYYFRCNIRIFSCFHLSTPPPLYYCCYTIYFYICYKHRTTLLWLFRL